MREKERERERGEEEKGKKGEREYAIDREIGADSKRSLRNFTQRLLPWYLFINWRKHSFARQSSFAEIPLFGRNKITR